MEKISIVTITYNSANQIEQFLQSIWTEKEIIREIIFIENNSPEKYRTKRIYDQYKNNEFAIKSKFLINKKNNGFGKSCNKGLKISKSKYVLFLNPDTKVKKDSLKILFRHMIEKQADIIGGSCLKKDKELHRTAIRAPNLTIGLFEFSNLGKILKINKGEEQFYYRERSMLDNKSDQSVDAVSGAYLLVRKDSFNRIGGFDEKFFMYLEDVDLGVRANKAGMNVLFCPHSEIWHVGGASSRNKYKIRHQAWFDSRKYYYKKHFGLFVNLIIQPLYIIEEFLLKKLKSL